MDSSNSRASEDSETEKLYELTRHSKSTSRKPTPVDAYWDQRHAAPDKRYLVESNAFERALLKYIALCEEKPVHVLARELIREAAMRRFMSPQGAK